MGEYSGLPKFEGMTTTRPGDMSSEIPFSYSTQYGPFTSRPEAWPQTSAIGTWLEQDARRRQQATQQSDSSLPTFTIQTQLEQKIAKLEQQVATRERQLADLGINATRAMTALKAADDEMMESSAARNGQQERIHALTRRARHQTARVSRFRRERDAQREHARELDVEVGEYKTNLASLESSYTRQCGFFRTERMLKEKALEEVEAWFEQANKLTEALNSMTERFVQEDLEKDFAKEKILVLEERVRVLEKTAC